MEQILDVLYNYIQENRIAYYLNGDPEYCLAGRRMDEAEEWLEANLPPEARARLERLAAAGCRIYRTDLQGNITLRIGAAVETERSDSQ